MRLLDFFRTRERPPAEAAKERLQFLLAHERAGTSQPPYMSKLHRDILRVICKYVEIDEDKLSVQFENNESVSMLEVNIELPNKPWAELAAPPRPVRRRAKGGRRSMRSVAVVPEGASPETA